MKHTEIFLGPKTASLSLSREKEGEEGGGREREREGGRQRHRGREGRHTLGLEARFPDFEFKGNNIMERMNF